jgi:hypothetical protein
MFSLNGRKHGCLRSGPHPLASFRGPGRVRGLSRRKWNLEWHRSNFQELITLPRMKGWESHARRTYESWLVRSAGRRTAKSSSDSSLALPPT